MLGGGCLIPVLDFDAWSVYDGASEGTGRSEKVWLMSPEGQVGLFKYPKSTHTTEHVSEKLASAIGELIGVPCAKCDIGVCGGRMGVMSYRIALAGTERMREAVHLITMLLPQFDKEGLYAQFTDGKKIYYSIELIYNVLSFISSSQYAIGWERCF